MRTLTSYSFDMNSRIHVIKTPFYLLALNSIFQGCYSDANQSRVSKTPSSSSQSPSILFPVTGHIYPNGYYYVTLNLGDPPTPYFLDIDTGSHLTWIQCDAPCEKCLPAPHDPYRPVTREVVPWNDPRCEPVRYPRAHAPSPVDPCDYYIRYVDGGSSLGVLITDPFPLQYTNGTTIKPLLAFGCGYLQKHPDETKRPFVDGVFALGSGVEGILSQLHDFGLVKKVVGHCFSSQGDGYLFIGDQLIPSSIVWTPIVTSTKLKSRYFLGSAELFVGGLKTGVKDLQVVFDSGSTFTYFIPRAHNALLDMLEQELAGQNMYDTYEDDLQVCWRAPKPFESIQEVKHLFKPIVLSFQNAENTWFELDPERYLLISKNGYVCLGILNGEEIGLTDINLIGDISFLDQIIVYDNENERIGWAPANCKDLPHSGAIPL